MVFGLTAPVVKYGGSVAVGNHWCFLLAIPLTGTAARADRHRRFVPRHRRRAAPAGPYPGARRFRLTTAGALLLGRVFSLWNMVAYGGGIAWALALDGFAPENPRGDSG